MSTTGTGTATAHVGLTAWTLDRSVDTVETTEFGAANKTYVQGVPDTKGTFSGFFDETESKLYVGTDSSDGVKLYLYPSSNALTKYWYGPAWVNYSVNTGIGQAVQISASFAANGAWGRN